MRSLNYPVKDFNVTSPFGPRLHPILNVVMDHSGVDIGIPVDSEIRAQADGEVLKTWIAPAGGLQMKVLYKNGLTGGYAHLNQTLVSPGQKVVRGELIALSGGAPGTPGAGLSTGPHLHYTIRDKNNNLIDPLSINYKPYRGTRALAGMPFFPFKNPKLTLAIVFGSILLTRLLKK